MDKYTELTTRWTSLETERASWMPQWREISMNLLPKNGRFFLEDRNKGRKVWNNIYDSTGTRALRTLAAGLMSGASSPARPWFRLQTHDTSLNAYQPVKVWLDQVTDQMLTAFAKSNTYQSLQQIYEELGGFGTGAAVILPDFTSVIHHYPLTCGEYCIATDAKGDVCTLYRRFQMQVSALVKEFGLANCSESVKALYGNGNGLDQWVTVQHSIEPRADRNPSKRDAKNMAWGSWWFEVGKGNTTNGFLREGGYRQFPGIAPRWGVAGGDIYGWSPAMEALGDVKQLQHLQFRKAQGIDHQTNPALAVPVELKNQEWSRLPGGTMYVNAQQAQAIKPLSEVKYELQYLLQDIGAVQQRVREAFFADLFLMLANSDPRMTATEVSARQEEKMLMLGPVLERLSNELFQPMINLTFTNMLEMGALPPPPQEMQGAQLSVELVSILAQAQKAIGTNGIDRFTAQLGQVAALKPDVLDKFDQDVWADEYADKSGVDPSMIIASDKVAVIRDARAKAQAAQQQAALQEQQSKTTKNLGQTPTAGPANAAMDMMQQYSGYGTGVTQ